MINVIGKEMFIIPNKTIESIKKTDEFRNRLFKNNFIDERNAYNTHRFHQIENDPGVKGIPMVFISTPLLNLDEFNINIDGFFKYLKDSDPELLHALSFVNSSSPFITIASNRMSEFTTADLNSQTTEVAETHYGYLQNLPLFTPVADTTNITYIDNANLDVLKVHKAWFDYIVYVTRGIMRPSSLAINNKFIDYTASIYHFLLDMDGETIQYFDKMTGCFPIVVPYSEFSSKVSNNQEIIEYSIEYAYSYREHMNPSILADFNSVSEDASVLINKSSESEYRNKNDLPSIEVNPNEDYYVDRDLSDKKRPMVVKDNLNSKKYKLIFV